MCFIRYRIGAIAVAVLLVLATVKAPAQSLDYQLGQPRVWTYTRVYPFLDGIFQDVSSTQIAPLVLNPNAANASQLDALQTAFNFGLTYSATTQAQNALTQQTNAVTTANAQLQTELLAQQAQLVPKVLAATQVVGKDTASLDQLNAATNPDSTQVTAAKTQLAADQDTLNSLQNQLSAIKGQLPSTLLAPQSYSAPSATPPALGTLPAQLSQLTTPPNAPGNPNFPSSKQMDNQVNLLWERLSRLVGTIAQADSLSSYNLVLAAFDVNLLPEHENKKIFSVRYKLTATDASGSLVKIDPVVVDLFPSASAVNIVNNTYRDSRWGLSAALSWMGIAGSGSYNREHLQISQALGQSAYITGFGVGTSEFGWALGRNLGDKQVSPGKRTVFAVIAVPSGANGVKISADRAGWYGENSKDWTTASKDSHFKLNPESSGANVTYPLKEVSSDIQVSSVAYSPTEFDPTATTTFVASLRITLGRPIDAQMTLSVDGKIIPRARDTFARAVTNAGGSGGLLESSSYTVNTWIPTSATTLIVSLDPSRYDKRFPEIVLASIDSSTSLSMFLPRMDANGILISDDPTLPRRTAAYYIVGERFGCQDPCSSNIPPLGFRKANPQNLRVFHVDNVGHKGVDPQIFLSLSSDSPAAASASSGNGNVQVLSSGPSPWGGNVVTVLQFDPSAGPVKTPSMLRLSCRPMDGNRLGCTVPDVASFQSVLHQAHTIEVRDPDHVGGPIFARAVLSPSSSGEPFVVWSLGQPVWMPGATPADSPTLLLCAQFLNAQPDDVFQLGFGNGSPMLGDAFRFKTGAAVNSCPSGPSNLWSGGLVLSAASYLGLTDRLTISRLHANGQAYADRPATLLNLHAGALPIVSTNSDDYLQLYGQNLVFHHIRIGNGSEKSLELNCDAGGTSCSIVTPTTSSHTPTTSSHTPTTSSNNQAPKNPLGNTPGPVYLVADSASISVPVMKLTSSGLAAFQYTPPAAKGGSGQDQGAGKGQFSAQISISANGNSSGGNANESSSTTAPAATPSGTPSPTQGATVPPPPTPQTTPIPNPLQKFTIPQNATTVTQ